MNWYLLIGLLALVGALTWFIRWNRRPVLWTRDAVADVLSSWIDGNIDYANWDYFESCEIADADLEAIRKEAVPLTWTSDFVEDLGGENERLNEVGVAKFKKLRERCHAPVPDQSDA